MITREDFQKVRQKASTLKALVIGDAMLDKYIHGHVDRISPEAPVPVLKHHSSETKAGGAANVALNLSAWGCDTTLIGLIGNDAAGTELISILDEKKINHHLYVTNDRPTTVKTRIVAASHHLLRIDEESSAYLDAFEESKVTDFIRRIVVSENYDLVIVEDYNKGLLTEKIISSILKDAKDKNAFIAVDPKEINFMLYAGADLFKPNLREAMQAAQRDLGPDDLEELADNWRKGMHFQTLAITLGAQGVFLQDNEGSVIISPTRTIDVIDVCGAGDAVICALTLGRLSGLDLAKSGALVNLTGAYVCSHSGVVTVDPLEIESWL